MNTDELLAYDRERKRQKDEYLQKNVIHTDPPAGCIQWHMWSHAPDNGFSLGHGVHYHDVRRPGDTDVVALIRGFAWQRKDWQGVVTGYYLQPDAITTPEIITELKQKIDALRGKGKC